MAASSLKNLTQEANKSATRVLVSTEGEMLVLAFVDKDAQAQIVAQPKGFCLKTATSQYAFENHPKAGHLLTLC